MCCFHQANRSVLQARPRKNKIISGVRRGVFAMRSPDRPNPISLTRVKLISARKGLLVVEKLDAANGTPVLDIKCCHEIPDNVPSKMSIKKRTRS